MEKSEKSKILFFITAFLSISFPIPGRLFYAIAILILFNIQMLLVTVAFHGVKKIGLSDVSNAILLLLLISITIMYKQFLIFFCPMLALILGFAIFVPALSVISVEIFFEKKNETLKIHFADTMLKCAQITAAVLLYFIVREALGYGTISFPAFKKVLIFSLPFPKFMLTAFVATIPGNLCLSALVLSAFVYIRRKIRIVRNSHIFDEIPEPKKTEEIGGEN